MKLAGEVVKMYAGWKGCKSEKGIYYWTKLIICWNDKSWANPFQQLIIIAELGIVI